MAICLRDGSYDKGEEAGWRDDGNVPVGWNLREEVSQNSERKHINNITVKRDNRQRLASKLPTIFVTNHRSFFPKFHNFVDAMQTLELTLGLHSEIWESEEKRHIKTKLKKPLRWQESKIFPTLGLTGREGELPSH